MSNGQDKRDYGAWLAILGAALLMAHFVAGKAARDSLFLVNFPVEQLPRMIIVAATLSLVLVVFWSRKLATRSPSELVPIALVGSGLLEAALWFLYGAQPKAAAVIFYLFMIGPNAILLSSYWSLLNERFDPRHAKRLFGRVAAGGTVGIVASGAVADRMGDAFGAASLLPMLAGIQFAAFLVIRLLAQGSSEKKSPVSSPSDFIAGFRILRANPYLLTLASLVFLVTISANLLDYVFKAGITRELDGENLVNFFALFYGFTGLATFLAQTLVAPAFFQRFGLTQSLLALPISYFAGVLSNLAIPGVGGLALLRGFESVTRGSIYRSGYEVCYTPVTNREKRATKTIVDVGADRFGEVTGGSLVQLLLWTGIGQSLGILLFIGSLVSAAAGILTYRMGRLYVQTLESSLITRAREVAEESDELPHFSADSIVVGTLPNIDLSGLRRTPPQVDEANPSAPTEDLAPAPKEPASPSKPTAETEFTRQPILQRIASLSSGDYARVRTTLLNRAELEPGLIPFLIRLLAWDEVSDLVIRLLRRATLPIDGQLADALLNPNEDFAVRRRIPRILSARPTQISAEALIQGLRDQRFEVRFRCSHALAAITLQDAGLFIDRDRILRAVEREFYVSKTVWNSYRLLERVEDGEGDAYFDEVLKDRTSKGLEHVFTLLSLVLPREPLQIAFKGLHTNDPHLRGTALEYLESVLPSTIRERLWPFLEADAAQSAAAGGTRRSRDEILSDLRRSNQSIIINLEKLQSKNPSSTDAH